MERLSPRDTSFEILDAVSGQIGFKHGYYRILTRPSTIKYLAFETVNPTLPDIRGGKLDFKTVPAGDWNVAHLVATASTDRYVVDFTEKKTLADIDPTWHPSTIDFLALGEPSSAADELQSQGQIYSTTHTGHFGVDVVIVNYEWYPELIYGPSQETAIYSLIEGHGIGARFLAHLTENGDRVIGYMVERLPHIRAATPRDLDACRTVLGKLHALGIVHGFLSPSSFLISSDDGRALLHSFATSHLTDKESVLDAEMAALEDVLSIEPITDEPLSQDLSDEIVKIAERDGGLHPMVIDQAVKGGMVTVTEEEHRALLGEWRRDGGLGYRAGR
jgi:serine/threonine protein kinase